MADTVGPALKNLLDTAAARAETCERPFGLVHMAPGNNVAWDDCEDCDKGGQLWVRVISILGTPSGSQPCDITGLQVRAALGAVRCVHAITEERYPTAEEMTDDTLKITADADLLLRAIREWEGTRFVNMKSLKIETGLPLGPEGACGGFEWTLSFNVLTAATAEGC